MRQKLMQFKRMPPAIWILIVMIITFSITADNYMTWGNISTIMTQASPLFVLALGQTFVVLTQGTDLSVGSSISMVTVMWIIFLNNGISMGLSIPLTILLAVTAGICNGLLVAYGGLPPFITTLGMQYILKTVALVTCNGASIYFSHPFITFLSKGKFLFLPIGMWIAIICFVVAWLLLYNTKFGARVFALGGNAEAVTLAGADVKKTLVMTYAFSGLMAGIAGLMVAGRIQSGNPIVGVGWEFNALAAVLLGGTSLREGQGGLVGTIFGVLLIQILKSGLNSAGVPSIMQNAIIGIVVILAIIFDAMAKRTQEEYGVAT